MRAQRILFIVRSKLKREGFDGLYYHGECACECSDLAPCGNVERSKNGYINDCKPGYKHFDPRPEHAKFGDFVVSENKEPMTAEEWDSFDYN